MKNDLLDRTKIFALNIIKFVQSLPTDSVSKVLSNQLLRAGTSVGANYRSSQRAKSKSDFIYKIKISEEEADESVYWLELIISSKILKDNSETEKLLKEANELTAILSSIAIKAKGTKN
ncbi:MAG: four helix bundle protein [Bacteroidota bacterium]